jgi:ADP-sugar diphosphatase
MPTTFQLSKAGMPEPMPITVADGLDIDGSKLMNFPAFKQWFVSLGSNLAIQQTPGHTFETEPWRLIEVKIHTVTVFPNGKIGFMTIEAILRKGDGKSPGNALERVVFLRGGSVAVLMLLRPKDSRKERYVILTEQPRIGACSTSFLEIPAGMLDEKSGDVKGKAIEEIEEETSLKVRPEELIDLTKLALEDADDTDERLQAGIYPSPANLDEYIPLLLWEKDLDRKEIEALKGKLTGERRSDEMITLRVVDYEKLWRTCARDAKALAAWALYEGLNRSGKISEKLREIRIGKFDRLSVI